MSTMNAKNKEWFANLLKGMVKDPDSVIFGVSYSWFDLEVIIRVAEEDKAIFTEEVCISLAKLISSVTGVLMPIVYLDGAPHPQATEAINYARQGSV